MLPHRFLLTMMYRLRFSLDETRTVVLNQGVTSTPTASRSFTGCRRAPRIVSVGSCASWIHNINPRISNRNLHLWSFPVLGHRNAVISVKRENEELRERGCEAALGQEKKG